MNWKNVAHLVRVDMKSGRLIRGQRLTRYREKKSFTYLLYGGALALGVVIGVLVGFFYRTLVVDPHTEMLFNQGLMSLFLSLPTLILIYSLVFTMMQQIQRSGVKFSIQAPYWLPITWEEHTLASTLANLFGVPLVSIVFIGSTIIVASMFIGSVVYAVLAVLAMLGSAFMASAMTEAFRVLQVRFTGAVYKSSGRAAVWVRFVGSLLFFIVFYIVYFSIVSGAGAIGFVQSVASAQNAAWFVPFVWLGMTLYSLANGLFLQAAVFLMLSILLILGLFYAAVALNTRFGLYEPPAITISRGVYAPRTGFLGKLGFSSAESALIRKDLKAFTRRRELMYVFILPIVFILVPLMESLGGAYQKAPGGSSVFSLALVFLLPSAVLAVFLGSIMIGEEGGAMWRIYSSPISAASLVKSKFFFMLLISVLVVTATGIIGVAVFHPSFRVTLIAFVEAFLLMPALGAVSLANGIKGADFSEVPRPRMIRTEWNLLNLVACLLVALAIVSPLAIYEFLHLLGTPSHTGLDAYQYVAISAGIAIVTAFVAYRIALRNARDLMAKAEM
jgi:hypothetical protein